ncbi:MAG: MobF family relaxase, partial [Acidimicrobiia bacterium]
MTVRVTTLKGQAAGRYYTERLPSYYLDGDEPPGHWWGKAADRLGLGGVVDSEAFLAVMAGLDPATRTDLGRHYGEESVRGYDATFSAPKSVSVIFALGHDDLRAQVVGAHDAAVNAVLEWVQDHAHTRRRQHGHVMCVDTDGIVVGVFRQHTSRRLDPQLHTHAVIANRVAADGRWLALDARTIKMDQRTLSALYHAALRAELTGRLGVAWQPPEHGISEIDGVDVAVLEVFSQRSHDIDRRLDEKLARFRSDLGREPSEKERWQLEREAVVDSRPPKPHGTNLADLHRLWRLRMQVMGRNSQRIVENAVGLSRRLEGIGAHRAAALVDAAVGSLTADQSSWRPAELVRELAAATPTTVTADAHELTRFLQRLAEETTAGRCVDLSPPAPTGMPRRRDGRPITEPAVNRALTTQAILEEEEGLVAWAERCKTQEPSPWRQPRRIEFVDVLTPAQVAVVAAVADGDDLELVVGPAGTGKTTTLAAAALNVSIRGRRVFGLAPTAAAAEVLHTEAAIPSDTLDKLLTEHSDPTRPLEPRYAFPADTTLIIDEAATASTPKLAQLARLADTHQWRVVLVGDPRQFGAVGRGGMFAHLVDQYGATQLDQVHRFTHNWERAASLRLRAGDPTVLAEYDRHGRLHDGTLEQMETAVIDAWHQARHRGEAVALMANTTDTVDRLNHLAQRTRIASDEIPATAATIRVGASTLHVGDEVVTRRNDRRLRTTQGHMVKNRDHWTITSIHPDGRVALKGRTGLIRLPADYVTEHLELGYAQTSHATQGRTVDTALLLIDGSTDTHGVYTPLTRGRQANHAYIATQDNHTARDVLTHALARDWIDQPAITHRNQLDPHHADQLEPPGPGMSDERDELIRQINRTIA